MSSTAFEASLKPSYYNTGSLSKLASLPRSFKSDESKALTDENLVDPAKPLEVRPELMFLDSFCDVPNK